MEVEFIAACEAGRELLGLRELFGELDMKIVEPMPIWMDNQAAIKQLEREKATSSAKHADIRFKFFCHYAQAKIVRSSFIKSGDMIANGCRRHYWNRRLCTCAECPSFMHSG